MLSMGVSVDIVIPAKEAVSQFEKVRHSREGGNPGRKPSVERSGFPTETFGNDGRFGHYDTAAKAGMTVPLST